MLDSRDNVAADAFVSRSQLIAELEANGTSVFEGGDLRGLMRRAFLQGWHEAMVARDGDDERGAGT
jgi:hypothetical protein